MIDITTKILLGLIALGLFANAANFAVRPVLADEDYTITLNSIQHDLHNIALGTCPNKKAC